MRPAAFIRRAWSRVTDFVPAVVGRLPLGLGGAALFALAQLLTGSVPRVARLLAGPDAPPPG
jgi:hypothetical protein